MLWLKVICDRIRNLSKQICSCKRTLITRLCLRRVHILIFWTLLSPFIVWREHMNDLDAWKQLCYSAKAKTFKKYHCTNLRKQSFTKYRVSSGFIRKPEDISDFVLCKFAIHYICYQLCDRSSPRLSEGRGRGGRLRSGERETCSTSRKFNCITNSGKFL